MRISSLIGSVEGLRRKLRGVATVGEDPAATEHEKANAKALEPVCSIGSQKRGRPQEIGRTTYFGSADGQRR